MGQCWRIFNLDTWQVICDGGKLGEWLFYDSLPSDLVELLAIPFSGTPTRTLFTPTNALGRLELPGEILLCIFDEVDDLHDAICLGLTNTALRSVGHKRIQRLIVETTAPWAGYRIVCLGEYMHNDDLPVDMLTEEEERIMLVKPTQEDLQDPTEYDHRHLEICATRLYNFAMEHFRTLRLQSYSEDFERQWEMPSHERKLLKELSTPLWEDTDDEDTDDEDTDDEDTDDTDAILEESTDTHESSITKQNNGEEASADDDKVSEQVDASAWVLCNLTKREYVRADATAALTGTIAKGPFINASVGLGEVLVSQICWSWDPSSGTPYKGPLHRGRWAGDSFEITTIGRMRGGETEWKDVSKEMLDVVVDIWDAEYHGNRMRWRKV